MTLIQAWIDSLSLLKPKNLKLFLLITLKSSFDTCKVLLKNWWYIFLAPVLCCFVPYLLALLFAGFEHFYIKHIALEHKLIFSLGYQAILFASLVASRPSLEQKDGPYFKRNMIYFLPITLLLLILPRSSWPTSMSPLYFFIILFLLDSPKRLLYLQKINGYRACDLLSSILRALKMIVYNFPLLLCIGLAIRILADIFGYLFISPLLVAGMTLGQVSGAIDFIAMAIAPIIVCLYTNIYIKKLHDQFDLYFKQPS